VIVVGRKKHLRFVFEPSKRRTMQNSGFVAKEFEAEWVAFDGELSPQRLRALLCKRRKLFLVLAEDSNDVEFGFHRMPSKKKSPQSHRETTFILASIKITPTGR
jgi:hypothetical protein